MPTHAEVIIIYQAFHLAIFTIELSAGLIDRTKLVGSFPVCLLFIWENH